MSLNVVQAALRVVFDHEEDGRLVLPVLFAVGDCVHQFAEREVVIGDAGFGCKGARRGAGGVVVAEPDRGQLGQAAPAGLKILQNALAVRDVPVAVGRHGEPRSVVLVGVSRHARQRAELAVVVERAARLHRRLPDEGVAGVNKRVGSAAGIGARIVVHSALCVVVRERLVQPVVAVRADGAGAVDVIEKAELPRHGVLVGRDLFTEH